MDYKLIYYPSLIYLFSTNISLYHNTRTNTKYLKTFVKAIELELTFKSIENILQIPYKGLELSEIDMSDEKILPKFFLHDQGLPMANNKL